MTAVAMLDLTNRTKAALEKLNTSLWLPDLTDELVEIGWLALQRDNGLTPLDYGTARVLAGDVRVPRNLVKYLPTYRDAEDFRETIPIELLVGNFARQYMDIGINFYTTEEIINTTICSCVEDAIGILNKVPTLIRTLSTLIRAFHIIKPEDDAHDVSFSEPHVPFSIFVSVPRSRTPHDALRVAEAIVHEAMHLQLTLIEQVVPLVIPTPNKYFSPWKGEYRTLQGVLHALYVFRVIDQFLARLLPCYAYRISEAEYIRQRRDEIDTQIRGIRSFQECSELTEVGSSFVRKLILN